MPKQPDIKGDYLIKQRQTPSKFTKMANMPHKVCNRATFCLKFRTIWKFLIFTCILPYQKDIYILGPRE